jgi:hypothetical protein
MNKNDKNIISIIGKAALLTVFLCLNVFKINTFPLMVEQDPIGIYCIKDNGLKAINEWVEIDFEGDNYLEYYYFDANGYLIMNSITPDGYIVNEKGQWIHEGVIQRKYYEIKTTKQIVGETKNRSTQIKEEKTNGYKRDTSSGPTIAIVAFILLLFIIAIANETNQSKYKNRDYNNSSYRKKDKYKTYYNRNTAVNNNTSIKRSIWWHLRSDTDKKGEEGEDDVAEKLKNIGKDFIVLRNINLPRANKDPVQIDFLCISNKGIFVIEVKNWLGKITGDYNDEIWHSQIYDIINNQKNPIKQNEWHVDVLKRFIRQGMTFYSIIVFTDRANIEWLDKKQNKTYITNIDNLNNVIYSIYEITNIKSYGNYKSVAGYLRRFVMV